jgi:hypothetical protein
MHRLTCRPFPLCSTFSAILADVARTPAPGDCASFCKGRVALPKSCCPPASVVIDAGGSLPGERCAAGS